jgi:hypothetical protein
MNLDSQFCNNYAVHHRSSVRSLMIACSRLDLDVCEHSPRPIKCKNVRPKLVDASKYTFPVQSDDDWSFSTSEENRRLRRSPRHFSRRSVMVGAKHASQSFRVLRCNESSSMDVEHPSRRNIDLRDGEKRPPISRRALSIDLHGRIARYRSSNCASQRTSRRRLVHAPPEGL